MTLSPQCQDLYKILLKTNRPLSAKELAFQLHIFHPTVYRLTEPLIDMGLITKTDTYPHEFAAKNVDEGLSLFLLHQNEWFSRQFFPSIKSGEEKRKNSQPQEIRLSFIQSRDELMNQSAEETSKTTKSIDLLRSGHEIPADVMLAIIEAKKRNVLTRMLIQDYSDENADQVGYWQKNDILVRKSELHHVRLMIYDASVVYFMSYKHDDSNKDLGMKISYPPLAIIFSKLFEEWWQKAKRI
ncbi:MAG: hypothetical protein HY425_02480 [Candidatus Levybacteria bacterium]|nr:hypothetical protein [Candidatus Levybacteria bacterium]